MEARLFDKLDKKSILLFIEDKLQSFCNEQDERGSVDDYECLWDAIVDGEYVSISFTIDVSYGNPHYSSIRLDDYIVETSRDGDVDFEYTVTGAIDGDNCALPKEQLDAILGATN